MQYGRLNSNSNISKKIRSVKQTSDLAYFTSDYALAETVCNHFLVSLHFHLTFTLFKVIYSAFHSSLCHHLPECVSPRYYINGSDQFFVGFDRLKKVQQSIVYRCNKRIFTEIPAMPQAFVGYKMNISAMQHKQT